jgi:hypothetical protein
LNIKISIELDNVNISKVNYKSMSAVFFDPFRKSLFRERVGNGAGMRGWIRGEGLRGCIRGRDERMYKGQG